MADPESIAQTIKEMNWEQAGQDDFMQALSQSLLIQTPLQVLLEMLFKRVTAQSQAVEEFKEKLGVIEKSALDVSSFLGRLQAVEGHVRELSNSKLSPFAQADILERLESAELAVEKVNTRVYDSSDEQSQGPRLDRMERQLSGVENLPGRLMAVDAMADELGVEIPNLEYQWSEENIAPQEVRTRKVGKVQKKIGKINEENESMQRHIEDLKREIQGLKRALMSTQKKSEAHINSIEESNKETRKRIMQDLQSLKRDVSPADGTSYSDFVKVASEVENLRLDAQTRMTQLDEMKCKDIVRLQEAVMYLQKRSRQADELHDKEAVTSRSVQKIEREVEVLKMKVKNAMSAALAGGDGGSLAGVARQSDLQEIAEELSFKPSMDDVRKLVNKALDFVHVVPGNNGDAQYAGRALKFRCLSCDREVVTQRPQPLGHLPSRQGLIPKFDSVPGRDSATPIGPGLNAAELRKLQDLAAERAEAQGMASLSAIRSSGASPTLDDRPNTANPTGFAHPLSEHDMERPMTSPHTSNMKTFSGPFQSRSSDRSKRNLTSDKGSKPPVFVA